MLFDAAADVTLFLRLIDFRQPLLMLPLPLRHFSIPSHAFSIILSAAAMPLRRIYASAWFATPSRMPRRRFLLSAPCMRVAMRLCCATRASLYAADTLTRKATLRIAAAASASRLDAATRLKGLPLSLLPADFCLITPAAATLPLMPRWCLRMLIFRLRRQRHWFFFVAYAAAPLSCCCRCCHFCRLIMPDYWFSIWFSSLLIFSIFIDSFDFHCFFFFLILFSLIFFRFLIIDVFASSIFCWCSLFRLAFRRCFRLISLSMFIAAIILMLPLDFFRYFLSSPIYFSCFSALIAIFSRHSPLLTFSDYFTLDFVFDYADISMACLRWCFLFCCSDCFCCAAIAFRHCFSPATWPDSSLILISSMHFMPLIGWLFVPLLLILLIRFAAMAAAFHFFSPRLSIADFDSPWRHCSYRWWWPACFRQLLFATGFSIDCWCHIAAWYFLMPLLMLSFD